MSDDANCVGALTLYLLSICRHRKIVGTVYYLSVLTFVLCSKKIVHFRLIVSDASLHSLNNT